MSILKDYEAMGKATYRDFRREAPSLMRIVLWLCVSVFVVTCALGAVNAAKGWLDNFGKNQPAQNALQQASDLPQVLPTATPIPGPIATAQVRATVIGMEAQTQATAISINATQSAITTQAQAAQLELEKRQNELAESQKPGPLSWFVPGLLFIVLVGLFGAIVAAIWSMVQRSRADALEVEARANTLQVDTNGNYSVRIVAGRLLQPAPGNALPASVPTSLNYSPNYAPHILHKNDVPVLGAGAAATSVIEAEGVREFETFTAEAALALLPRNKLAWCFGRDLETGEPIIQTLHDSMHTLTVGSSGMGKTTLNANLLYQLVGANDANTFNFTVCDLKSSLADPVKAHAFAVANEPGDYVHIMEMMRQTLEDRRARKDFHGVPWLVVLEEALAVRNYMTGKDLESYSKNLEMLSLLAREYRIYVLASQQVDYSSADFKNSRGQFLTRVAGAVPPRAAGSMGFFNTPLVNQNWKARQPGQFLIESPSGDRLIRAPKLDVKGGEFGRLMAEISSPDNARNMPVSGQNHANENQAATAPLSSATPISDLSPENARVLQLFKAGKSLAEIIKEIYNVSSSAGKPYQTKNIEVQEVIRTHLKAV